MSTATPIVDHVEDLWPAGRPDGELDALVYRSNLLGAGPRDRQFRRRQHVGQGHARPTTPAGRRRAVGEGLGSDLATIGAARLHRSPARRDPAAARARRDERRGDGRVPRALPARPGDAAPLDRDAAARVRPAPHVDHTHPDAIGGIVGTTDGERLAEECFGDDAALDPLHPAGLRALEAGGRGGRGQPGGEARPARQARARHVGRDRRGVRTAPRSTRSTARPSSSRSESAAAAHSAAAHVGAARRRGARRCCASCCPRCAAPCPSTAPRLLQVDTSPRSLEFACGAEIARELSQVGAACPDHLVHTRRRPLWVAFDPAREDAEVLRERDRRERGGVPARATRTSSAIGDATTVPADPAPGRRSCRASA